MHLEHTLASRMAIFAGTRIVVVLQRTKHVWKKYGLQSFFFFW